MQYPPCTPKLPSPPGWMEESREADFQVTSLYTPFASLQKHEASPAGCALLCEWSFLGPQEPKHLGARRVWAAQNRQSLPLNSNENTQCSLWKEDDTNHLPKGFVSIISISSCPEAAGSSNAPATMLGLPAVQRTPLWYLV